MLSLNLGDLMGAGGPLIRFRRDENGNLVEGQGQPRGNVDVTFNFGGDRRDAGFGFGTRERTFGFGRTRDRPDIGFGVGTFGFDTGRFASFERDWGRPTEAYQTSWTSTIDSLTSWMKNSWSFDSKDDGDNGILIAGQSEWTDYKLTATKFVIKKGRLAGIGVRVQGQYRYYAFVFEGNGRVAIIKVTNYRRVDLAATYFDWEFDTPYDILITIEGNAIRARVGEAGVGAELDLEGVDDELDSGAVALIAADGAVSAENVRVDPTAPLRRTRMVEEVDADSDDGNDGDDGNGPQRLTYFGIDV